MSVMNSFNYCPRCAAKMSLSTNMLVCPECGLEFYFNPKPCASVILRNEANQLLLAKRAVNPRKGYLDIVGGYLEESESLEEGARREVKEELGIEIEELVYVGSYTHPYKYQGVEYFTLTAAFTAQIGGNLRLAPNDDIDEIEWFAYRDLPYDMFAFIDQKNVFEKLAKLYNL